MQVANGSVCAWPWLAIRLNLFHRLHQGGKGEDAFVHGSDPYVVAKLDFNRRVGLAR